jgi:hypothetical protein
MLMMLRKPLMAAVAMTLLAACAPDAWNSYKATGFNEYLDTVGAQCQPLWIGQNQLRQITADSAGGWAGGFDQFLDSTSRLYYNRVSPAAYRDSVQQLAGSTSDTRTNRSIDCIISKLPPDRPSKPPGGPL